MLKTVTPTRVQFTGTIRPGRLLVRAVCLAVKAFINVIVRVRILRLGLVGEIAPSLARLIISRGVT